MRIIYLCPSDDTPTGGIKVIYRHAELLRSLGAEAFILHPLDTGFRCTWFDHRVRFLDTLDLDPKADFVVIPELWAGTFGAQCRHQGLHYALFVQNGYLTPPLTAEHSPMLMDEVYRGADIVLSISEDTTRMIALNYPALDPARVLRVQYSVHERFLSTDPSWGATRGRLITFMPRKLADHAGRVVYPLRQCLPPGWEIAAIDKVDEATCAAMLFSSRIFLAFSQFEGLPLPPLEAALAGNVVIGYTGQGAREYWGPPNFQEIHQGNIIGFVHAARHAAEQMELGLLGPETLQPGINRLAERFSEAAETWTLRGMLKRIDACLPARVRGLELV
jgi:hypothetical protein